MNQGTAAAITGGWPVIDGAGTDTTGTLTSGAGTVNASIDGYASIKVQIKGTYAGFTFTTNASSDGGTTFVPIQCALVDGSQFGTSFTLTANQSTELACGHQSGDDTFQVSASAGPASGTANIDISPSAFPSTDGATVAIGKVPNGANVALGNTTDAVGATPQTSSAASLISIAKAINNNVASAIPAGTNLIGKVGIDQTTPGTTNGVQVNAALPAGTNIIGATSNDPCASVNKTNLAISQNGTSSVQLIALSGSTTIYVCSLSLIAGGATTAVITTGTGTACVTNNAAVIGDTTTNIANGLSFASNGGLTLGNGGGTIAKGASAGELCMALGTSVRMSGNLTYVQQ